MTRTLVSGLSAGIAATALFGVLAGSTSAQQSTNVPALFGGWTHPFGGAFPPVPGSALPVLEDPQHPFTNAVLNFRYGDLSNPNLKPWVKESMQKDIDEINHGKIQFTANSSCLPSGMPMFDLLPGPFEIIQAPNEVIMLEEQGPAARHIYLDVAHSAPVKPSWNGELVGHYEGDSLVIDTVGVSTKTVVDAFRTPHTEKLHVNERWHLIDGGNMLQVDITVDDPDTFYQPWKTYQRYQRTRRPFEEFICPENNTHLFNYHIPEANTADF